jgi:polysaccharide deacetylase 2 family uncharacterized protein YibQ
MADAARLNNAVAMLKGLGGQFSPRAFIQGLIGGLVLLALYAAWLWSQAGVVQAARQARLAATTATIDMSGLGGSGITLESMTSEDVPPTRQPDTSAEAAKTPAPPATPSTSPSTAATASSAVASADAKDHPAAEMPSVAKAESITLPPAPEAALLETTDAGRLPIIDRATGRTPFDAYRRPYDMARAAGKPVIALMVSDTGLPQAATDAALKDFPPQVSMALSPYAAKPDDVVNAARAQGHEVWMMLPMQSPSYPRVDPGPYTLLTGVPSADNLKKLKDLMGRAAGYAGLIGSRDGDFPASNADFGPVIDEIDQRGLGFIDPSGRAALDSSHPSARADVWFARSASESEIDAALKSLEDKARMNGHAIGVIPPLPLVYKAVNDWIKSLDRRGFAIVPVSAVADKDGAGNAAAPAGETPAPPPPGDAKTAR